MLTAKGVNRREIRTLCDKVQAHQDAWGLWQMVSEVMEDVPEAPRSLQSPAVLVRYGKALSPAIADCLGCQTDQQPTRIQAGCPK